MPGQGHQGGVPAGLGCRSNRGRGLLPGDPPGAHACLVGVVNVPRMHRDPIRRGKPAGIAVSGAAQGQLANAAVGNLAESSP